MKDHAATQGACPFRGTRIEGAQGSEPGLDHWWPNRLKVELLYQDPPQANPLGRGFDYAEANARIDHAQLWEDVREFLHTPVDWWPSDYGHYGPQMNRMSWHSAGTYRISDGRGGAGEGMQRFAPINSWWDNGNTDKSRRLLAPIKAKYGPGLSWADLIALAGTVALEDMGLPLQGFAYGREDAWSADAGTYWGPEGWMGKSPREQPADPGLGHPEEMVNRGLRWKGDVKADYYDLEATVAATHQSLIYVDPEGPNGNGNPLDAARDIRESFARMAMNDEETVALVAGGHAFGKSHGAVPAERIGGAPEIAKMSEMGLGWHNPVGSGNAEHTMTNGIEGAWTPDPTRWDNAYLENMFKYEWEQTKSPAGSLQWTPKDPDAPKTPDAHRPGVEHPLMLMTTDLAFKMDPDYRKVCERFLEDFDYFTECFSKAWHKLMHRDLGPTSRWLGPDQGGTFIWQDPVPEADHPLVEDAQVADLKARVLDLGLAHTDLIAAAWASASTYRDSDKRGGANGGRVRLAPQAGWEVNDPARLGRVLDALEGVKSGFDGEGEAKISMADLIVLAGCAGIEAAAKAGGHDVTVPFVPGRTDAVPEWTDAESFEWLRPVVDRFRNYVDEAVTVNVAPERLALDKACLLKLTAPEWSALTGGLRVLDQNWDGGRDGVFTDNPGTLSADFFRVLTDTALDWRPDTEEEKHFALVDRASGETRWTATRLDLIFGANAELRQVAELYAGEGGEAFFLRTFVDAWHKVMMLDRFDMREARKAALSDC